MPDERWDVESLLQERFDVPAILAEQHGTARRAGVQRAYRQRLKAEVERSGTCPHCCPLDGDNGGR